jgi:xanthine dehydrogenase accessory factor
VKGGGRPLAIIRGGGDLASGAAARLHRAGFGVMVLEIATPLAVRRLVSFAQAVYAGEVWVEEIHGARIEEADQAAGVLADGSVPVLIDPDARYLSALRPRILVDGRMRKAPPEIALDEAALVIGLGPGFTAGSDCHAVVETKRGPRLGRVIWQGSAASDTGVPEPTGGFGEERVLRAPDAGVMHGLVPIGTRVRAGQAVAEIAGKLVAAPFDGVIRGLLHDGLHVEAGTKLGDIDPRNDPSICALISDKSLAVGGGVLEAALSRREIRRGLGE